MQSTSNWCVPRPPPAGPASAGNRASTVEQAQCAGDGEARREAGQPERRVQVRRCRPSEPVSDLSKTSRASLQGLLGRHRAPDVCDRRAQREGASLRTCPPCCRCLFVSDCCPPTQVSEIAHSPWAEVCWYLPITREQYRLTGTTCNVRELTPALLTRVGPPQAACESSTMHMPMS